MVSPQRTATPAAAEKIAILEKSLTELLDIVVPEIRAGTISSIVVDDTSARPIGLFLHRGADLLGCPVPIVFVCPPGTKRDGTRDAALLPPRAIDQLGAAPLIVTEVIYSGEAVGSIVRALNDIGKVPAIASLSGFLVPDDSEPHSWNLKVSRTGRQPPGRCSKIIVPATLSYEAQDILCSDKILSGVLRETADSTTVRPTSAATESPAVRREITSFREELYRLARRVTRTDDGNP